MNATSPPTQEAPRVRASDIAKKYDVTESYIYKLAKTGKIPFIKVGGSVRFDLAAVVAAIEGGAA